MDEKAIRIAEETRLRERAQALSAQLREAQDSGAPEAPDIEITYKAALREHDSFLSGFDDGEGDE